MSDLMLLGILRMPDGSIAGDCAGFMQFVSAARSAADRIESDAKFIAQLRAELEAREAEAVKTVKTLRKALNDALPHMACDEHGRGPNCTPAFQALVDSAHYLAQRQEGE